MKTNFTHCLRLVLLQIFPPNSFNSSIHHFILPGIYHITQFYRKWHIRLACGTSLSKKEKVNPMLEYFFLPSPPLPSPSLILTFAGCLGCMLIDYTITDQNYVWIQWKSLSSRGKNEDTIINKTALEQSLKDLSICISTMYTTQFPHCNQTWKEGKNYKYGISGPN